MHDSEEPFSYSMASENVDWLNVMRSELEAIKINKTCNLVELPPGRKPIGLKLVYKLKKDSDEKLLKHKSRLVEKSYIQNPGIDFDEVFAPVSRLKQ